MERAADDFGTQRVAGVCRQSGERLGHVVECELRQPAREAREDRERQAAVTGGELAQRVLGLRDSQPMVRPSTPSLTESGPIALVTPAPMPIAQLTMSGPRAVAVSYYKSATSNGSIRPGWPRA